MRIAMLLSGLPVLVVACTTPADPPSLLPRAIEQQPDDPVATQPATVPVGADAPLKAQLAAMLADARAGDAEFTKIDRENTKLLLAAQRASQGSDQWINAQMTRSAMEAARQKSAGALADVDSLAVARAELASRDPSAGGLAEILAAQAQIAEIVEKQTQRLAKIIR